jgi:hypothetical protein
VDKENVPNEILNESCSVTQMISFIYLTEQGILSKKPLRRQCICLKYTVINLKRNSRENDTV